MSTNLKLLLVAVLVVGVGLFGWHAGRSAPASQPGSGASSTGTALTGPKDVKSIISYTLPDGWTDSRCGSNDTAVQVIPGDSSLGCGPSGSSYIKLYIDPQNTTDCAQLQPVNDHDIVKHTCKSLFIGGKKSLLAVTQYKKGIKSDQPVTMSRYLINTGRGVAAAEYSFSGDDGPYQAGFDQLALSVKAKN